MAYELIYPKKNMTAIIFLVVLALAIAAAVFLYMDIADTQAKIDSTYERDYSDMQLVVQKGALTQAPGVNLTAKLHDDEDGYAYVTPIGFPIISFSDNWKNEKLVEIYEELLRNKHGDEINALSGIILYPEKSKSGGDVAIAGTHITQSSEFPVFFHLPGFVPPSLQYGLLARQSVIELYNMDEIKNAADVAKTIAHEYGHHYTMHYFLQNDEAARSSDYYRLRGIDALERHVFFDTYDAYLENHMWSIYEMAAEDYVQLMGSPNAKQTREYGDVFDSFNKGLKRHSINFDGSVYNVFPQENFYLPLADEVEGLRNYYLSFIGEQSSLEAFEKTDFNIRIEKLTNFGHAHYLITWDKTTKDKDALYTLISYDMNGIIYMPVRTVRGNEDAKARIGTAIGTRQGESGLWILSDRYTEEPRYFKLYVIWPDGRMQSSELVYVEFN